MTIFSRPRRPVWARGLALGVVLGRRLRQRARGHRPGHRRRRRAPPRRAHRRSATASSSASTRPWTAPATPRTATSSWEDCWPTSGARGTPSSSVIPPISGSCRPPTASSPTCSAGPTGSGSRARPRSTRCGSIRPPDVGHVGQMFAFIAFAENQMAEFFCNGIPLTELDGNQIIFGNPVPTIRCSSGRSIHADSALGCTGGPTSASGSGSSRRSSRDGRC